MVKRKSQIRDMTDDQIIASLCQAAVFEREHTGITYEHGLDLVNIVAVHGDKLAAALAAVSE